MTISIGRFGLTGCGYTVDNPEALKQDGSSVTMRGTVKATSAAQAKAVRQNVLGLGEIDEPVVPVVYSRDSDFNGYYRVLSASVDQDVTAEGKNWVPWAVALERVPDYPLPQIETITFGGFRTNSHGITPTPMWWVPNTATAVYWTGAVLGSAFVGSRTCEDGTVLGRLSRSGSVSAAERKLAQYLLGPGDWYDGSCRIEVSYGGTYYPVVGRSPYSLLSSTGWRITNGRLRVAPSSTAGRLDVSIYDTGGSTWETTTFKFYTSAAGSDIDAILSFAVLRNAVDEVVVRLVLQESITGTVPTTYRHTLDLTLRRGCHHVECYWVQDSGTNLGYVKPNTVTASTTLTGGIRATSNDAASNRYVIYTPRGKTNDLVNGGLYLTAAANNFPFALGIEYGGSGAGTYDTAAMISDEYFGAYAYNTLVLGR